MALSLPKSSAAISEGASQLFHRNVQRFRGGLVFKTFVSLNSRLDSNEEEKKKGLAPASRGLAEDGLLFPEELCCHLDRSIRPRLDRYRRCVAPVCVRVRVRECV